MKILKPMLAARVDDPKHLRFPLLLTPKIDGIRCLKVDGKVLSRSFKPIRNRYIASCLATLPDGVDGELILRDADFSDSQSGIMSADGRPDFQYCCFDLASDQPYNIRVKSLLTVEAPSWFSPLTPVEAATLDNFSWYEEQCLKQGFEGVMARSPGSPYKFGRSTLREHYLMKLKRYQDSEAVIIGFVEAMENQNDIELDNFGYSKRPGGNAMMFPKGTLGGLLVRDGDVSFSIGTGFDNALRQRIWDNQSSYLGRVVTYRFQQCGTKDRPRFPSFVAFREDL